MTYSFGSFAGQIGQQYYSRDIPVGMPGTIEGFAPYRAMPFTNQAGAVQAVYTITPPGTVDASTVYSLLIDGILVILPATDASPTTLELGTLIYNAIRAEPQVYRKFDVALNGSSGVVTLTHRLFNTTASITSPTNATTTNDLTIANTVAVGTVTRVPFGRFVGRLSSWTVDATGVSNAALIDHASNYTTLGVTLKQFYEKDVIGPDAVANYPPNRTLNVLQSLGTNKGVWVECVENDIIQSDTCYIAVGAGNQGKVTKTSSGNAAAPAGTRFVSQAIVGYNGQPLVLISGFSIFG